VHPLPRAALARALPFLLFVAVLALRGALGDHGAIDERWLYLVQAGAALAALAWLRRSYWPATPDTPWLYMELGAAPRSPARLALAVAVGLAVFVLWINATASWMRIGTPVAGFVPLADDGSLRWELVAPRLLGAVAVVPLIEELMWRSLVMRWIDRRDFLSLAPGAGSWLALVLSSAVFALEHDLWLGGLCAGLAYALIYRATANLWYPVIAHAVTNAALGAWVVATAAWSFW